MLRVVVSVMAIMACGGETRAQLGAFPAGFNGFGPGSRAYSPVGSGPTTDFGYFGGVPSSFDSIAAIVQSRFPGSDYSKLATPFASGFNAGFPLISAAAPIQYSAVPLAGNTVLNPQIVPNGVQQQTSPIQSDDVVTIAPKKQQSSSAVKETVTQTSKTETTDSVQSSQSGQSTAVHNEQPAQQGRLEAFPAPVPPTATAVFPPASSQMYSTSGAVSDLILELRPPLPYSSNQSTPNVNSNCASSNLFISSPPPSLAYNNFDLVSSTPSYNAAANGPSSSPMPGNSFKSYFNSNVNSPFGSPYRETDSVLTNTHSSAVPVSNSIKNTVNSFGNNVIHVPNIPYHEFNAVPANANSPSTPISSNSNKALTSLSVNSNYVPNNVYRQSYSIPVNAISSSIPVFNNFNNVPNSFYLSSNNVLNNAYRQINPVPINVKNPFVPVLSNSNNAQNYFSTGSSNVPNNSYRQANQVPINTLTQSNPGLPNNAPNSFTTNVNNIPNNSYRESDLAFVKALSASNFEGSNPTSNTFSNVYNVIAPNAVPSDSFIDLNSISNAFYSGSNTIPASSYSDSNSILSNIPLNSQSKIIPNNFFGGFNSISNDKRESFNVNKIPSPVYSNDGNYKNLPKA